MRGNAECVHMVETTGSITHTQKNNAIKSNNREVKYFSRFSILCNLSEVFRWTWLGFFFHSSENEKSRSHRNGASLKFRIQPPPFLNATEFSLETFFAPIFFFQFLWNGSTCAICIRVGCDWEVFYVRAFCLVISGMIATFNWQKMCYMPHASKKMWTDFVEIISEYLLRLWLSSWGWQVVFFCLWHSASAKTEIQEI